MGLVSEPKTAAGRYAKRIGKFTGATASFGGGGGWASPIAAGVAGQSLEELGAPPWVQAAGEIVAALKFSPKKPISVSSKSKEVEEVITEFEKSGVFRTRYHSSKKRSRRKKVFKKVCISYPRS